MKKTKGKNGGTLYSMEKGETLNPHGRPRKSVSYVLNEFKKKGIKPVSADEIRDVYLSLINNTQEELEEIVKDKDQPMLTKLVIKAMLKGKGIDVLEKMFDRGLGKPLQTTENKNTNDTKISQINVTIDEK